MALYYRRNIRFVAHAHFARFDNKRLLPLEIGIVAVLPEGVRERLMVLLTIDQSGHYMTGKDCLVNREASAASHGLPLEFKGEWSQEEAERRARKVVGKDLVAVKGLEMKRYFQSIGIANVVELKSEVYGDCPKFDELDRPEKMPCSRHRDHRDPWRCSRVVSHSFARYIEERRRSDPVEDSDESDWGESDSDDSDWACDDDIPPPVPVVEATTGITNPQIDFERECNGYIPPPVPVVEATTGITNPQVDSNDAVKELNGYIPPPVPATVRIDLKSFKNVVDSLTIESHGIRFVFDF